ncbi:MAG: GGDEF domain-containing protein [Thermoleophilia bacterium]|nr:GGDEF domain-containing protein [Thermoleophilia bacterium]
MCPRPAPAAPLAVILIEPDREIRERLALMISAVGARVAAVGTPLAARASAAHRCPSLVVAGPGVDDEVFSHLLHARTPRVAGCDVMRLVDGEPDGSPHAHPVAEATTALGAWASAHAALAPHARGTRVLADAVLGGPDPVFVLEFPLPGATTHAVVTVANEPAGALLGVPAAAIAGRAVGPLPGAASLRPLLEACARAVAQQAAQEMEMEVDGGRRHLAFRLLPLASSVAVTSADVSVPRRDGERRAALSKVADGVAHAMAFPQLCRLACDMIATHLRAGFAAVGRCNGERVSTVAVNHGAPMTGPGPADGAASALWTAARTGSAARTAFGPGGRDGWPRHAAVEEVAVPLTVDGATWGAVMAAACDGAGIAPDAEGFMESMAHLLAVAIGHEEFRRELITHARTDGLTGLPNRRAFEERLDEEVTRAHRHGRRLALAIFDVDRFKAVNDTHGHTAGDDVLREVAVRLARMARVGDLVARLGGEEFAWLMTDTDARGAYAAIERARLAVADAPFPTVGDVTVSVGVADLGGGPSRDALYRNADAALYRAKHAGRNRTAAHRVAAPSPAGHRERAARRAALCETVARALGWGEPLAGDLRRAVLEVEQCVDAHGEPADVHMLWSALAHQGWDAHAAQHDAAAVLSVVRVWDSPSAFTDAERRLRLAHAGEGLQPAAVAALARLHDAGALAPARRETAPA